MLILEKFVLSQRLVVGQQSIHCKCICITDKVPKKGLFM